MPLCTLPASTTGVCIQRSPLFAIYQQNAKKSSTDLLIIVFTSPLELRNWGWEKKTQVDPMSISPFTVPRWQ
jgi:hypothetical protein